MENSAKISIDIDEKIKKLFEQEQQLKKEIEAALSSACMATRSRTNSIIESTNLENNSESDSDSCDTRIQSFFEENYEEITEMVHELIDEYLNTNILEMKEPDFHEKMFHELEDHLYNYFDSIALENIPSIMITEEIKDHMPALYDCFISSNSTSNSDD